MGKKSPSDNSADAARITGEMNRETARDMTYADRPDQSNAYGDLTWSQEEQIDPATGELVTKWKQNYAMKDDLRRLYDSQMSKFQTMSDMSSGMMGRVNQEMGSAADWDQFGDVNQMQYDPTQIRQAAEDAAYQRETMRLDPRFESEGKALEAKLRGQGLRAGDAAYDAAIASQGNTRNDAYERARLGATSAGGQEADRLWQQQMQGTEMSNALRDKQISEYIGKRGFSLGEANSLDALKAVSESANVFSGA